MTEPRAVQPLVDEVIAVYRRFVWFQRADQYLALALWTLHTWAFEAASATPYIYVYAPHIECGKTRVLDIAQFIAREAELVNSITPAVLFRDVMGKVMLIDEVERIFGSGPKSEAQSTMQQILNAGYKTGSVVKRAAREGGDFGVRRFPTFYPKAFTSLRDTLPDTLRSRSIPILMHRHPKDVQVARLDRPEEVKAELQPLVAELGAWGRESVPVLKAMRPEFPGELGDRQSEVWAPLFNIADLGGLGTEARDAAVELHRKAHEEEPVDLLLLRHIRDAFDRRAVARLSTADIVKSLLTRDDDPPWPDRWGSWTTFELLPDKERNGRMRSIGMTIAKMLRAYDIEADRLQIGPNVVRGYERAWFEAAWKSYL